MSAPSNCCAPCNPTEVINVPGTEGLPGAAGTDGTNGVNSFTFTTEGFAVPTVGNNVVVQVADSTWMVVGQIVVAEGPAHFSVVSKPNSTSVVLQFEDYTGDVVATTTIASGSQIGPAGTEPDVSGFASSGANSDITSLTGLTTPLTVPQGGTGVATLAALQTALGEDKVPLSVFAAGTAYSLTTTPALLDFGTTDPTLVIDAPGQYLLIAWARIDYVAATFAANQTGTIKLRRTNNTPADLTNGSTSFETNIITTETETVGKFFIVLPYSTVNSDDALELWGDIAVLPGAGSIDAVEAGIVAVRLFDNSL